MTMNKISAKQEINLNKIITNKIDLKVLNFFHNSPNSIDTPRGVCAWINEKREGTKKSLDKLAGYKILNVHKNQFATGYSYSQDRCIAKKIAQFLKEKKI